MAMSDARSVGAGIAKLMLSGTLMAILPAVWADAPREPPTIVVQSFSPHGEVKGVRQVVARFSAPIVNFGEPRAEAPFDVNCAATGHGHWADTKTWLYDFDKDLPGALVCQFRTKVGLVASSGSGVQASSHEFNTGGPAILASFPSEGSTRIDQSQVFLLALDATADLASVREHAYCNVSGVGERLPVEPLEGKERDAVVTAVAPLAHNLFAVLTKRGSFGVLGVKDPRFEKAPLVALRCARPLPPGARVDLVWGPGIAALDRPNGTVVATGKRQSLPFEVRPHFTARQTCERMKEKAGCVPVLPIEIAFSAPVRIDVAERLELHTADGAVVHPTSVKAERGSATAKDATVESVSFPGPFAPKSRVIISLPPNFTDDAGRRLENAGIFPLKVAVDDDPPLVKVGSNFGILEANADPIVPVSVRNVEATLAAWHLAPKKMGPAAASGASLRIDAADDAVLARWMKRILTGPGGEPGGTGSGPGDRPILLPAELAAARKVALPMPKNGQGLQLIGVPLPQKGLHVLQFASDRLGAVLHGERRPYYVYTGVLVTNLALHFKRGRESSLAWVTRLDTAQPVSDARVQVSDCTGRLLWSGRTDGQGVAQIERELPQEYRWKDCPHASSGLFVTARTADDMTLMLTSWSGGIDSWQFNLTGGATAAPIAAHTVTDRPLFRAGETVSMKHFVRRRSGAGFHPVDAGRLPRKAVITHLGSGQRFELELAWQDGTAVNSWKIPKEAKSGEYDIELVADRLSLHSGDFRVEQFRVPLMRATLKPPSQPIVRQDSLDIVAQLSYMAGGPAAGQSVKFRSRVIPRDVAFSQYDDFHFGGENPKEGLSSAAPPWMNDAESDDDEESAQETNLGGPAAVAVRAITLDASGGASVRFDQLPMPGVGQQSAAARSLEVEMEYADPNGQILTASTRVPLLASRLFLGLKVEGYFATREKLAFKVLALDADGRPQANRQIDVQAFQRTRYAYRKRLLGGFYAYEQSTEIRKVGSACSGVSDAQGLLVCEGKAPASGELILVAQGTDGQGSLATGSLETYVAGSGEDWFEAGASDRIDLLPDRRSYEPGETARFEVRMPFRHATVLVTVEREGVLTQKVVDLDASAPYIEILMQPNYGPNVYVSALVVRGRVPARSGGASSASQEAGSNAEHMTADPGSEKVESVPSPTALVDLAKPAFRLGLTQIRVGWSGYALQVKVETDKSVYPVRGKVPVTISVSDAAGRPMANAEIAVAAVDEGLLELRPNQSWDLLAAMMQRRPLEVQTSTAQSEVIGKRHFGKKAVAPGGGGGSASARELFDTLLFWQGRIPLDPQGRAHLQVPLNDSLSSFRIEAIASANHARFGSGSASVRTSQDLMLFGGLSPFVREGDAFEAMFTVRNAGSRGMQVEVAPSYRVLGHDPVATRVLAPRKLNLAAGAAQTMSFEALAPPGSQRLEWAVEARETDPLAGSLLARDRLVITQRVGSAYPVQLVQQTLLQLEAGQPQAFAVEVPRGAIRGRGGVEVRLARSLGGDFSALRDWLGRYPYSCLEQKASAAVINEDRGQWDQVMQNLPVHLDADGLARYFPASSLRGDDALTAYLLAVSDQAGYSIPDDARERMLQGLTAFVEGRITRWGALPTADLAIRKLAAIEALARYDAARPQMLEAIDVAPDLWPSSALIDWMSILVRLPSIPQRDQKLDQARQILRARLTYSGTAMLFSTEKSDYLWWLMVSPDRNAARALLLAVDDATFAEDIGRLARGALGRQLLGHWNTTIANAWGVLALRRFQMKFEKDPVSGQTVAHLGESQATLSWDATSTRALGDPTLGTPLGAGPAHTFEWPPAPARLSLEHKGSGRPWAFVASKAALPLAQPLFAGYSLTRTITPVEQKLAGRFSRGDVWRIRLDIEAQQDMTWVAVSDPIPAGATVLGTGLGGESAVLTQGETRSAWNAPTFEERGFEGYRAYYEYLPKGHFRIEYTVRLNNAGRFLMPPARAEAMYAPEVFGEIPVASMEIAP